MRYDVITFGETMLRFTPPHLQRIEQTNSFDLHVGGSESNTAVGLARLGLRSAWLSRLTDNPLGRVITGTLTRYGIDTSHVIWTDENRVGTYFFEEGKPPRGSRVIYDRADSAMSRIHPDHLPSDLFQEGNARLLHITGITPALSDSAAKTTLQAMTLAKQAGWLVSFDLNYRGLLWSPEEAADGCAPFMSAADILFVPLKDAQTVYNMVDEAEATLANLKANYPKATIAVTMGGDGAIGTSPNVDHPIHQPTFPAEEVGRLGGGDAFSAGFIYGYLSTENTAERLSTALRWGAAVAAIKYTIPGDIPLIEKHEAERLVSGGSARGVQR